MATRWQHASIALLWIVNFPLLTIATLGSFSIVMNGFSPYSDDQWVQIGVLTCFAGMVTSSAAASVAWQRRRIDAARNVLLAQFVISFVAFCVLLSWAGLTR